MLGLGRTIVVQSRWRLSPFSGPVLPGFVLGYTSFTLYWWFLICWFSGARAPEAGLVLETSLRPWEVERLAFRGVLPGDWVARPLR